MKTLYIIRHAKSSWSDISLRDFDRPLNSRGKKDAPEMGKRLKSRGIMPDLIISSSANRAITTAKTIAREICYPEEKIIATKKLYLAGIESTLETIHKTKEDVDSLVIVGHNPGWTDFSNYIKDDEFIENIPTCGIVAVNFEGNSWNKIERKKGKQLFFDYPKKSFG